MQTVTFFIERKKMNQTPIFTVTTIQRALVAPVRCVGFFHELENAHEWLRLNEGDINEDGYYPFAVIEEVKPGFYTFPREERWYQWNKDTKRYVPCEKPERFKSTFGWGMG